MWLFKFKLFFKYPISPWCRASWICRINELYTFSKILILYSGPSAIHLCYLTIATKFQFNCIWNEKNGLPVWTRVWVRLRLVRAGLVGQALSYSTKIRFYLARSGYLVCVCVCVTMTTHCIKQLNSQYKLSWSHAVCCLMTHNNWAFFMMNSKYAPLLVYIFFFEASFEMEATGIVFWLGKKKRRNSRIEYFLYGRKKMR